MWKKIFLILYCAFAALNLLGQYATGLLIDQTTYPSTRDFFQFNGSKNSTGQEVTQAAKLSLRTYCPRPRIQGDMASCSGWAAGYAALSVAYSIREQWPQRGISTNDSAFSALFVYNQIKIGSCNGGSSLTDALTFLQKTGNVRYADFDASTQDCHATVSFRLLLKAQQYRIKDYFKVFEFKDKADQKLEKVKQCIRLQKPIIVAINLLENFKMLNRSNPVWYPQIGNTSPIGAHAMVIIGYDDRRKSFEVMNSWGEAWGEGGFAWIRYEDFPHFAQFGFLLELPQMSSSKTSLYGSARLRRMVGFNKNTLIFDTLHLHVKNNVYQVVESVSSKDKLQILIEPHSFNSKVEVFSLFPGQPLTKHSIPNNQVHSATFIIPDQYRAIEFTEKGQYWLIVTFAKPGFSSESAISSFNCQNADCIPLFIEKLLLQNSTITQSKSFAGVFDENGANIVYLIFEIRSID